MTVVENTLETCRFNKKYTFQQKSLRKYFFFRKGWGKYEAFTSIKEMNSSKNLPSKHLKYIPVPLLTEKKCIAQFDTSNNGTMLSDKKLFWQKELCGGSFDPSQGRYQTSCGRLMDVIGA